MALQREVNLDARVVCLALFALYIPLRQSFLVTVAHSDLFGFYSDAFSLILVGFVVRDLITRVPSRVPIPIRVMTVSFLALYAIAWAVNPSPDGALLMIRLVEISAVASCIAKLDLIGAKVVLACLGLGLVWETALGVAELIRGEPVGLLFLGEQPMTIIFHSRDVPQGTFIHPYYLAGFGLVIGPALLSLSHLWEGRARLAVTLVGSLAGTLAAITYSRMALLGLVGALAALLIPRSRKAVAAGLLLVAFVVPAAATAETWIEKGEARLGPGEATNTVQSSSRLRFTEQSFEVIGEAPLVGVGPSRYVDYRIEQHPDEGDLGAPVHNVPLLIAADAGIPAGILSAVLLLYLFVLSIRSPGIGLVIFMAFIPFVIFDCFPYCDPQSIFFTGIWTGTLLLSTVTDLRDVAQESVNEPAGILG